MNKRQKEVAMASLNDEKAVLNNLKKNYSTALADIKRNIKELQSNPLTQSKAYQLEFQKQLEKQLSGILDNLEGKNFASISDYLNTCYNNGFLGSMYDIHGQGVPIISPINQNQVLKAVQKTGDDVKLSTKLSGDTKKLKNQVLSELQRGFSTSMSYTDIARNISGYGEADMRRSMLIARTEGHRVQQEAKVDSFHVAKSKGADIVKQWDSTLDDKTRDTHRQLDGQIVDIDDDFTVDGMSAPYPGGFGDPAEDCNCRCTMLQRAKWALDESELETLKERAEYFGLDKTDDFNDFCEKYLKAAESIDNSAEDDKIESEVINQLEQWAIDYKTVQPLSDPLSENEIISRLGGGDMTKGSCSSLGFAYMGNKNGLDVLDFRDGDSRKFFARTQHIADIANIKGVKSSILEDTNDIRAATTLLKNLVQGKEYYLATGRHAAIVRKTDTEIQYLELQSSIKNGFKPLTKDVLKQRFGCKQSNSSYGMKYTKKNILIESDSLKGNAEFKKILGYINTSESKQVKGASGSVK